MLVAKKSRHSTKRARDRDKERFKDTEVSTVLLKYGQFSIKFKPKLYYMLLINELKYAGEVRISLA